MEAAATNNHTSMSQLTSALRYFATVSSGIGGAQSSLQVIGAAENRVQYWLAKVIDERIEAELKIFRATKFGDLK